MEYIKRFVADVLQRPSLYFFVFLIIFTFDRHHRFEFHPDEKMGPFFSDPAEYYRYLPDFFIHGANESEQSIRSNKRTIGMAIMYAPSFFVGHLMAKHSGEPMDGYSWPYQWTIRWGSIIYCILGLIYSRKSLLLFFREPVVAISLACIFFGTNLFLYTYGNGEFPHSYLFFLNAAFIYYSLSWIRNKKQGLLILIFFIGGMITLIRPTAVFIFLVPVLFDVHSLADFIDRLKYFFRKPKILSLSILVFAIPLLAQMLIWKRFNGHYIFYSYGNERFFFNDPQVVNFLFSFRKGWLVYTPIMAFSLIGMIQTKWKLKPFFPLIIIYFTVVVYVLSSWYDWAFGGSFGCRVLIESYAVFIFAFATFVSWCWYDLRLKSWVKNSLRAVLIIIFYLLIRLNIFQTWQSKYVVIHWNGMNKEVYKYVFLKPGLTKEEYKIVDTMLTKLDTEKMLRGERDD